MTPRLRWRKQPNETGLRRIGRATRGFDLWYGEQRLGWVSARENRSRSVIDGWYWVTPIDASLGIEYNNTCDRLVATAEEAKTLAVTYVKSRLTGGSK